MQRRPTMRDVAAAAGVSVKTVSRVVNDEAAVRDVVADRVRAAIAALGYRPGPPSPVAAPARHRSATIGFDPVRRLQPVLLGDLSRPRGRRLGQGLRRRGRKLRRHARARRAILKRLIGGRVDGLVVVPAGDEHTLIAEEVGRGTPVVLLDLEVDDLAGVDLVRSDHRGGARLAVEHLIAHGHRDIAYLGDVASIFSARERYQGYVEAMRAAQLKPRPDWALHGLDTTAAAKAVRALFADGVDAATERPVHRPERRHDRCRAGPPRARAAPRRSPSSASTTSTWPTSSSPGSASCRSDRCELGRLAGELLLDRIGGHRGPARRAILANEIDRPRVRRDPTIAAVTPALPSGRWPTVRRIADDALPPSTRWSPTAFPGSRAVCVELGDRHAVAEVGDRRATTSARAASSPARPSSPSPTRRCGSSCSAPSGGSSRWH